MVNTIIDCEYLHIYIPITDKVLVICGNSGTGKTKMLDDIIAIKNMVETHDIDESTIKCYRNIRDIKVVKDITGFRDIMELNTKNKIIFVDHATTLLALDNDDNGFGKFIEDSPNLFILLGHGILPHLVSEDAVLGLKAEGNTYTAYQIYQYGKPIERID
ncbi:MAG: hypothetical protein IJ593_04980 [Lachnospiraceae bacterium]|nr:hypothetical protein [Lachnospiraceae bacterium]